MHAVSNLTIPAVAMILITAYALEITVISLPAEYLTKYDKHQSSSSCTTVQMHNTHKEGKVHHISL